MRCQGSVRLVNTTHFLASHVDRSGKNVFVRSLKRVIVSQSKNNQQCEVRARILGKRLGLETS